MTFRVLKLAPGLSRADWLGALEGFNPHHASTLKMGVGSAVYRATMLGRPVIVKVRLARGPLETLKRVVRASRGFRQWAGAERLAAVGIRAAACVCLASEQTALGVREWLVLEALPGRMLLDYTGAPDGRPPLTPGQEHALARAAAGLVRALDAAGLHNADHKPSNIIVTSPARGELALVDTAAIRSGSSVDRMVFGMLVEPLGLGHPPRRTLCMRVVTSVVGDAPADLRRAARTRLWRAVERRLAAHADPTPGEPLEPAP